MTKILIIEDENRIAELLSDYLQASGMETEIRDNGLDGLSCAQRRSFDLILLDLMLPGLNGVEVCKRLRQESTVPIIMLTAKIEEEDRLKGLLVGADDYICKPFSPREVVARVQAVLRRATPVQPELEDSLVLDESRLQVELHGETIQLTLIEFRILQHLKIRVGQVLSRRQIMAKAYEDGRVVSDRTVDSHIKKLRLKLAKISTEERIYSMYSVGYRYLVK